MAKTIIDNELSSVIQRIISSQQIEDIDKESLRRQAGEAMQIYGRSRAFVSISRFEGILGGMVMLASIICAFAKQPVGVWVAPLTIAIIATIVFGILTIVFRSRYRARLSNLQGELSARERRGKNTIFPIVPFVCIIGPFINNYRGFNVEVKSQNDGLPLAGYSNLGLTFVENSEGGTFDFHIKNMQGSLSIKPRECAIVTANIQNKKIVFSKQNLKLPETAFAPVELTAKPAPEINDSHDGAPTLLPPQSKRSLPVDQTANELVEERPIDFAGISLSVPNGKAYFLVVKNEVCDMLKPGDYPFVIDSFPRLKALDPDALSTNQQSLKLLTIDTERIYRINWKIDGLVFAKGDVELKVANPRLFLNCVIEDDLFFKTDFENEVLSLARPSILSRLQVEDSSDYDAIEKNLLKDLAHSLDKLGLSVVFIGLNAFSKEEMFSQRTCVHCGKNIPGDSLFCSYCGKKQEDNICPNCGAEIPEDALFCPKCGTRK
ncbi:MAG: zinc-ribbon domain-containing protein [Bacilli bacterium]|nr:zinc-ribbon domain-containing protein [Bacilli bacterium]